MKKTMPLGTASRVLSRANLTAFYDEVTGPVNKGEGMDEKMWCYLSKVSNKISLKIFRESRGMD